MRQFGFVLKGHDFSNDNPFDIGRCRNHSPAVILRRNPPKNPCDEDKATGLYHYS